MRRDRHSRWATVASFGEQVGGSVLRADFAAAPMSYDCNGHKRHSSDPPCHPGSVRQRFAGVIAHGVPVAVKVKGARSGFNIIRPGRPMASRGAAARHNHREPVPTDSVMAQRGQKQLGKAGGGRRSSRIAFRIRVSRCRCWSWRTAMRPSPSARHKLARPTRSARGLRWMEPPLREPRRPRPVRIVGGALARESLGNTTFPLPADGCSA